MAACRPLFLLLAALALPCSAYAQGGGASFIVRLVPGVAPKSAEGFLRSALVGANVRARALFAGEGRGTARASRLDRYMVVQADGDVRSLLEGARTLPIVEEAFENHRYTINGSPDDSLYSEQWALERIEAPAAWMKTQGDSSISIGVLDTGVEWDHPDLVGAFAVNAAEDINRNGRFDAWPLAEKRDGVGGDVDGIDQDDNGFADDVIGFDFVDQTVQNAGDWSGRDPIPADEQGHGTNVAGVIGARSGNRIGVAGLAPGCRLVVLRAFDAGGNAEDDDIAAALVYAADRGVRVVNLSFGDYYASPLLRDAIAYAHSRGVVTVASSGNEGGSDPHYPSSFPEVIGVGATDRDDFLAPFTTFGMQLSLSAPGVGIVTTGPSAGYRTVGGTSFSAPYVAAAAGLLLSLNPSWSPDEVRTVLELSADDRGRKGWDINYGAGRLNVRRALEFPGAAAVAVSAPTFEKAFRIGETVEVHGSAFSPILESWSIDFGFGDDPAEWTQLVAPRTKGRLRDTLARFPLSVERGGLYTLRLQLRQSNGRSTERRVRLYVDLPRPEIRSFALRNVWRFGGRAVAVTCSTMQLSRLELWLRPAGSVGPYRQVSLESERTGWVREHFLFVAESDAERGVPYDAYVVARNAVGDTAMVGAPKRPLLLVRDAEAFSPTAMQARPYALPYGYVLNIPRNVYTPDRPVFALNRFADDTYGPLVLYEFDGGRFVARDSVPEQWLPRGFGDTDNDGLAELLVQSRGAGRIYSQTVRGGNPLAATVYADTVQGDFWADALHDMDGDGRDEVIARTDNNRADPAYYYIAKREGGALVNGARLENPTPPAAGDARNKYGPPEAQTADFDGDGRPDLLIGDDDADFTIYTAASGYEAAWTDVNDGEGGSEYVAAADIDGDGRAEAIVAYRSRAGQNTLREYAPPLWTVKAFSFDSRMQATLVWRDSVAYVRSTLPFLFYSGVAAGDLDNRRGAEVVLALFPSLYVFTWDSARARMRPFWYREGVIANRPVVADLDGDGVRELGVGDGRTIGFYQYNAGFQGPRAPGGFQGWALNDSTVYLDWNAVPEADYYTLYRGVRIDANTIRFDSVARTAATSIRDTGFVTQSGRRLEPNRVYYYIVTARNTAIAVDDSLISNAVVVFTHNPAAIVEAVPLDERRLRLRMGFPMKSTLQRPGAFEIFSIDGSERAIETVISAGADACIVTLREDASGDSLRLRPTALLRDVFDTPADTAALGVRMPAAERPGERFIATRATLVTRDTVAIDFNAPIDPATAAISANYVFEPEGTVRSATPDPANPSRCLLAVASSYPVGALGLVYTVTINGVRSGDGRLINDGAGSVVGFSIVAPDLETVYVYPHPFSQERDGGTTFAGLTRTASIAIYTPSGQPIATVTDREGMGGVRWNGRDDRGNPVPPGVYLYIVTGTDAAGNEFRSPPGKIAVVP